MDLRDGVTVHDGIVVQFEQHILFQNIKFTAGLTFVVDFDKKQHLTSNISGLVV